MIYQLDQQAISDVAPLWQDYAASHSNFDLCFRLQNISHSDIKTHLLSEWLQPGHHALGYYCGGCLIAFIRWATADLPFPHKSMIHGKILDLFVSSSHRRNGIGTALFRSTEDWLHKRDIHRIHLSVAFGNTDAIAFWKHLGFSELVLELRRHPTEPERASKG